MPAASLTTQTIACLRFFNRSETPLDNQALKAYGRLRQAAPDFETFQRLAPPGSEDRRLFERHLASFDDAGWVIRTGQMREDLFFDSWCELPRAWVVAQPYVLGLRAERNDSGLYRHFEWLAGRAAQFWLEREHHPPEWRPITRPAPTPEDRAVFDAFDQTTPRDPAEVWAITQTWIRGFQHERGSPHVYENVAWLAEFEQRWRRGAES